MMVTAEAGKSRAAGGLYLASDRREDAASYTLVDCARAWPPVLVDLRGLVPFSGLAGRVHFSGTRTLWLRGLDLNQRPSGYEPDELPDCSTAQAGN